MDYPPEGKVEEGNYVNNRKEGVWIKYHNDGVTPKLIANFKNNRPSGKYTKFYSNGIVKEKGTFSRNKYADTLYRYWDTGLLRQCSLYDENGEAIMDSFYHYREYHCLDHIDVYRHKSDTMEIVAYSKDSCNQIVSITKKGHGTSGCGEPIIKKPTFKGKNDSIQPIEGINPVVNGNTNSREVSFALDSNSINGSTARLKEITFKNFVRISQKYHLIKAKGGHLKADGYMKLYNKDDEIIIDGEFKNYQLWNGKVYIYDEDGILLRIKVYKNGKYHSDGIL